MGIKSLVAVASLARLEKLSPEKQEQALLKLRNKLAMDNQGIARKYAHSYSKSSGGKFTYEDCFQEGMIAILDALRTFDGSRGAKLSTHLCTAVQMKLARFTKHSRRMVALPDYTFTVKRKLELYATENDCTIEEAAKALKVSKKRLAAVLAHNIGEQSISGATDSEGREYVDIPEDSIPPDVVAELNEEREMFNHALDNLTEEERSVITARFNEVPYTEIAKNLGLEKFGPSVIKTIERTAHKKLKQELTPA